MNKLLQVVTILPLFALAAAAQDAAGLGQLRVQLETLQKEAGAGPSDVLFSTSGVMGPAVKGAPYSADASSESSQTLSNGTRIHNETRYTIYRDSQGRIRQEFPDRVLISDPVANTSYTLDPKAMTATKLPLAVYFTSKLPDGAVPAEPGRKMMVVMRQNVAQGTLPPPPPDASLPVPAMAVQGMAAGLMTGGIAVSKVKGSPHREPLGTQTKGGIPAQGTRDTLTLPAGSIGNDTPIDIVTEGWYSPDLQTAVESRHSDPRMGEEVFSLTNIRRQEPASSLFEIPAGYQVVEPK